MGAGQRGSAGEDPAPGDGSPRGGEAAVQSVGCEHRWAQPPRHPRPGRHHQRDRGSVSLGRGLEGRWPSFNAVLENWEIFGDSF